MQDGTRNPDGTWAAGHSGNISGKNGWTPINDALRALLSRDEEDADKPAKRTNAQRIALEWVKSAKEGKLDAITSLTDRVEGKPVATTQFQNPDGTNFNGITVSVIGVEPKGDAG